MLGALFTLAALATSWHAAPPEPGERAEPPKPRIEWRDSVALGTHEAGELRKGVQLPRQGRHFFTWDPIRRSQPDRPWRRWGTDDTIRTTLRVISDFARANPRAPRVGIGDISLKRGGDFGAEVSGGIGHFSHQNGLDVDVYYPLRSGAERAPDSVGEVDVRLAQDLVERFVRAGAIKVFVGPSLPLEGPAGIVVPAANHDNHLHARFAG